MNSYGIANSLFDLWITPQTEMIELTWYWEIFTIQYNKIEILLVILTYWNKNDFMQVATHNIVEVI